MVIQRVYGHDSDLSIRQGGRLGGRRMGGGWDTTWAADGRLSGRRMGNQSGRKIRHSRKYRGRFRSSFCP
jgi:hypothetical protein